MRDCANCTPDHLLCTTYSIAAMLSEPIPQDDFMCVVEDKGRTAEVGPSATEVGVGGMDVAGSLTRYNKDLFGHRLGLVAAADQIPDFCS